MENDNRNLYAPPEAATEPGQSDAELRKTGLEYVGFWARTGAAILDSIILIAIILPAAYLIYGSAYFSGDQMLMGGWDFVLNYVFPAVAVLLFWKYYAATPGKMAIRATIVDADTGDAPSTSQLVIRYFAYILSALPLCLGYFWVGWDPKKQAWHDKIARTVVVRPRHRGKDVVFDEKA